MKRILFSLLFLACNYVFAQENMEISKNVQYLLKSYLFQISFTESPKSDSLQQRFQKSVLNINEIESVGFYNFNFYKVNLVKSFILDSYAKHNFLCDEIILAVQENRIVYCLNGCKENTDLLSFISFLAEQKDYSFEKFRGLRISGYNLKKLYRLFKKWRRFKKRNLSLMPCNNNKIITTVIE